MAHKLFMDGERQKTVKRYSLPSLEGKYGLALLIRGKQVFLGFEISNVEVERVVRKRLVKTPKSGVRVLRYDPNL